MRSKRTPETVQPRAGAGPVERALLVRAAELENVPRSFPENVGQVFLAAEYRSLAAEIQRQEESRP